MSCTQLLHLAQLFSFFFFRWKLMYFLGLHGEQRISSLDFSLSLDPRTLGFRRKSSDMSGGKN